MGVSQLIPEKNTLRRRIPLTLRPRWPLWGCLMAACVLAALLFFHYPAPGAVAWAVGLGVLSCLRLALGARGALFLSRAALVAAPPLAYTLVEVLNYNNPWTSFTPLQVCLNLIWYCLLVAGLYLITGRRGLSAGLCAAIGWGWGMANHYVLAFRGRTIFPGDLASLRTAFNVAGNYDYTPDMSQLTTGLVLLAFLLALALPPRSRGREKISLKLAAPMVGAGAAFLILFFSTNFLAWAGIEPSMWTTRGNGLALNFSVCLRYSRVEEPEGYGEGALEADDSRSDPTALPAAGAGAQTPTNLVVIMNESFSDLSVIPGVESNRDPLSFWSSLTENTVKGYAYASVFGGTTANSEYEFLTGNTTAFLPAGTVPYQMYVTQGDPTLVGQMKTLGYRAVAMHPYLSSGWNRIPVYGDYGFDEVMFERDFTSRSYIRDYVSDRSNYDNLIRVYEEKPPGEPLFLFNITMQNHSAYNVPWKGLERTTWLTGSYGGRFSTVDQYLSLVAESDDAFSYLIDYFSGVEEPTMVVMFGDHQPQVATNFYTEALGGEAETLPVELAQRKQMVPFLIWTNYDIPEADGVELSLNYLSALVVKTANLPMTGYQKFLEELRAVLPVINAVGVRDAAGSWTAAGEVLTGAEGEALDEYQQLLYNNIFDKENRLENFFTLEQ